MKDPGRWVIKEIADLPITDHDEFEIQKSGENLCLIVRLGQISAENSLDIPELINISPEVRDFLERQGILSVIYVPMPASRGIEGVLDSLSHKGAVFNQMHLELLQVLAKLTAVAIGKSRAYAEQKKIAQDLENSISAHNQLLKLVLENQGTQVIVDTLSELVESPLVLETSDFEILFWSRKGYQGGNLIGPEDLPRSINEVWDHVESLTWFTEMKNTKGSVRVVPSYGHQNQFAHVITPIVESGKLIGYISAIEIEKPLNDQQRRAIEEASIIFALEFVKQKTARASMLPLLIAAQEDERKRIARELHDETSQALSALMVSLDMIKMDIDKHPELAIDRLEATKAIADEMLDNIHRLVSKLRPNMLDDLGLIPAVTWYCEQRLKPLNIIYKLDTQGIDRRLSSATETALYRIIQEGITNVIRHAGASFVSIKISIQDDELSLIVEDDGHGFTPNTLLQSDKPVNGIGLWGIQERVKILKGELYIHSAPGEGTKLEIRVPASQKEMENE